MDIQDSVICAALVQICTWKKTRQIFKPRLCIVLLNDTGIPTLNLPSQRHCEYPCMTSLAGLLGIVCMEW